MDIAKVIEVKSAVKDGKTFYYVKLFDDTEGYYDGTKLPDLKKDDVVEYSIIKEVKGKKYLELKYFIPLSEPKPNQAEKKQVIVNPKLSPEVIYQEKCKGILISMQITMDKLYTDQMDFDKVKEWFKLVNNEVQDAMDDVSQE